MKAALVFCCLVSLGSSSLTACGGGGTKPKTADDADENGGDDGEDIPTTPQKEAPPGLTDAEKSELATLCNPIENDIYEANKKALATVEAELANGTADADAEKKALEAGLAMLADKTGGLGAPDHKTCLALFEKRTKLNVFNFEPAERPARDAVSRCTERAVASFGKQNMAFDMGGSSDGGAGGPFCPDEFPVPPKLSQLPYKSTKDDWDVTAFKCLQFGLRGEQLFQFEYAAPIDQPQFEFFCIARFLPRQGGAPVEIIRGGKVDENGELQVGKKAQKRRMSK